MVRTAGWAGSARAAGRRPAGDGGRPQNRAPHTGSGRGRPAADGGVLNITAADWTAGFHWWRSGNKKRTQNVSEYMLVLALCLVECSLHYKDQLVLLSSFNTLHQCDCDIQMDGRTAGIAASYITLSCMVKTTSKRDLLFASKRMLEFPSYCS